MLCFRKRIRCQCNIICLREWDICTKYFALITATTIWHGGLHIMTLEPTLYHSMNCAVDTQYHELRTRHKILQTKPLNTYGKSNSWKTIWLRYRIFEVYSVLPQHGCIDCIDIDIYIYIIVEKSPNSSHMYDHVFMDNTNRQAVCKSQKILWVIHK